MRHILVTGGAGFIGANFVHYWMASHPGDRLVVLDALTYAGNRANLQRAAANPRFRFVHGNLLDLQLLERVLTEESIDLIVHFAAESHVDRSIVRPDAFIETNVVGTHNLLMAARRAWTAAPANKRLHHVSTDEVYGSLGPTDPAFTESTPYAPNSPYAASKASADFLVRAYRHTYRLPVTISNCSNNYGPYHFPEKLIPLVITNILDGKPLPIYGDGLNVRDWLYVEDHCRGIERVIEAGLEGETYNIGGENERTNIDIVKLLCELVDEAFGADPSLGSHFPRSPAASHTPSASLITYVKDRPGHDRRYSVDTTKIRAQLGFRPAVTFENGIRRTLSWYLENEKWWRGVMDGSYRKWIEEQYGDGSVARRAETVPA